MSSKPWFAPKRYGYGATPSSWEGWAATILFVILFGLALALLPSRLNLICALALLAGFIALTYVKTS
ncbi:MAG TPA: hypothetical protein VGG12_02760, partial [Methylovirgula sp.]